MYFGPSADFPVQPADFPRELDQLGYMQGRSRRNLTLFRENGLKLLIEEDGRSSSCISIGPGEYGSLTLYGVARAAAGSCIHI